MKLLNVFAILVVVDAQKKYAVETFDGLCMPPLWLVRNDKIGEKGNNQAFKSNLDSPPTEHRCQFCDNKLKAIVKQRCCRKDNAPDGFIGSPYQEKYQNHDKLYYQHKDAYKSPTQYNSKKMRDLSQHVVSDDWDAKQGRGYCIRKQFLKTWKHTPISRAGKVRTTLYNECCNGECDINEINETALDVRCCQKGCRYQEVLDICQAVKYDQI